MKIAAATLAFSSQHSATFRTELGETLRVWAGPGRPDFEPSAPAQPAPAPAISPAAFSTQAQQQFSQSSGAQAINDAIDSANHDPMLQLIRAMLEMLTGHIIRVFSDQTLPGQAVPAAPVTDAKSSTQAAPQPGQVPMNAGFGIEYDRHQVLTETEQSAFQAAGSIRTADGKEIRFQLALSMQRRYREESDFSLRAGDAIKKDPLVINFGGTAAQLQSRRFNFDLAGNGQAVALPMLAGNSGYLALDLNGNGRIDSGRELFGTASGNGFADLAGYDSDANGWIDENDPAFSKLRVWTPSPQGEGGLSSLQDKGVWALFLGHQLTPFELRDASNHSLGAVRASGIYLGENGSAGTLQHIDLSI